MLGKGKIGVGAHHAGPPKRHDNDASLAEIETSVVVRDDPEPGTGNDCPEVDGEEAGSGRFGDIDRVKSLVDESRLMIVLTMTVTRVVSLRLMVLVKMVVGSSV